MPDVPFHFEMKRRMDAALRGIEELKDKVDTLIVVPNPTYKKWIETKFSESKRYSCNS